MTRTTPLLLLLACGDQIVKLNDDTANVTCGEGTHLEGTECLPDELEPEDSGSPASEGEGEGEGEGDSAGEGEGESERLTVDEACDAAGADSGICCLLLRYQTSSDEFNIAIEAVDPTTGGEGVTVVDVDVEARAYDDLLSDANVTDVGSLFLHGLSLYACGMYQMEGVYLLTGEVHDVPNCTAATLWQGDDTFEGGIVVLGYDGGVQVYGDAGALHRGEPDAYLGALDPRMNRIAIHDGVLYGTGYVEGELSRWSLPDMVEQSEIPLEGLLDFVHGISIADGVLYLLDNGLDDDRPGPQRIRTFDLETGAQLGFAYLDDGGPWRGLHCESR